MVNPPGETETSDKVLTKDGVSRFDFYRSCLLKILWFLIAITVLLASLRYICLPLITHLYPEVTGYFLDTGVYGAYPRQGYVSSELIAPQANVFRMSRVPGAWSCWTWAGSQFLRMVQ